MKLALLSLMAVVGLSSATFAQAETFHFTYFGHYSGGYTMVSCDYASYQAETLFAKFGVTGISSYCSGGIQPGGMMSPISLTVEYTGVVLNDSPVTRPNSFESEPFGSTACDFNTKLFRAASPTMTNVTVKRSRDACFYPTSDWSYQFDVRTAE